MRVRATIANAASLSGAVEIGGPDRGQTLVGLQMPAAWTAAAITFQACDTIGGTYQDVKTAAGTEVTVTAAAGDWIALDPAIYGSLGYVKVRSGATGAPVAQGAARTIALITRKVG